MNKRLIAIICLQILLLFTIVGKYYYVAATGKLITIETAPIDPRDLFYGDYVTLNYEISSIERSSVETDLETDAYLNRGTAVYVVLEKKKEPFYEAVGVYKKEQLIAPGQVMLKGKLNYSDEYQFNITYGLERYYVPENTGREIEAHTKVDIRVTEGGEAVIEAIRGK